MKKSKRNAGKRKAPPKAKRPTKPAKAAKASKKKTPVAAPPVDKLSKRKLGLRGAAPWAARHAAKHAAEARARAAEPPLPGSARATIRTPSGAEDIKAKIAALHQALSQIKSLRKNLTRNFFDIGNVLREVQNRKLYEAKGYGTFEAFLEREIDLGKTTSLRLVRISQVFQREASIEIGMERLINGLLSIDVPDAPGSSLKIETGKVPPAAASTPALPLKPPGR